MLYEMVRPYQGIVHQTRITSVNLINGTSPIAAKTNIPRYFFNKANEIYSDKLSAFALLCEERTKGAVMNRLKDIYEYIFIDEFQDLAGFDLDLVEALLASPIQIILVGDVPTIDISN